MRDALSASGLEWQELPGEGAFYGPKIEYQIRMRWAVPGSAERFSWISFSPERLGAEYVTEANSRARPVMLHRAILGSLERFIGILIENHAGNFPFWLSPVQAVVLNISDSQADYAREVANRLLRAGFRVESDLRNEKLLIKYANIACASCLTSL